MYLDTTVKFVIGFSQEASTNVLATQEGKKETRNLLLCTTHEQGHTFTNSVRSKLHTYTSCPCKLLKIQYTAQKRKQTPPQKKQQHTNPKPINK